VELHAGTPFWPIRDGLPNSFPPLAEDAACDVLVVGAGITGALVASELADRGHDVLVVDRRDAVLGSTAASTALLLYEVDPEFQGLRNLFGPSDAAETYARMAEAVGELAALSRRIGAGEFTPCPSLYLASRQAHVPRARKEYEARRRLGLDVEWLDAKALRRDYGCARPAAVRAHGQGHIDPYAFTHGLLAHHRKRLRVFDRTAVRAVRYTARQVQATTDRGSTIRANHIVFATGYETQLHRAAFPKRLFSTYALVSEPGVRLWEDQAMFWETNRPYLYGRCTADGRLMLGGHNDRFRRDSDRDAAVPAKARGIVRTAARIFPRLEFEPAYAWGGTFAETRDGLPYVGADPKHPLASVVLGYGANGTVFARLGAQVIADQLEGKPAHFPGLSRPGAARWATPALQGS
jgi:glycine/D-amino acid oxidase-like deaminating enzyme